MLATDLAKCNLKKVGLYETVKTDFSSFFKKKMSEVRYSCVHTCSRELIVSKPGKNLADFRERVFVNNPCRISD